MDKPRHILMLLQTQLYSRNKAIISLRTFKNFGHGREFTPTPTVLWHGFLTFTFIGLLIEWKKVGRMIFGDSNKSEIAMKDFLEEK